jgi:hypothetical protein
MAKKVTLIFEYDERAEFFVEDLKAGEMLMSFNDVEGDLVEVEIASVEIGDV